MHKSRLAGFIIDCKTDDLKSAAAFWGGALGMEVRALPGDEGNKYVQLVDPQDRLHVEVQSVSHPSRVHLDIETDDVEAEVRRLERLGREASSEDQHVVGHGGADGATILRRQSQRLVVRERSSRVVKCCHSWVRPDSNEPGFVRR